MTKKLIWRLSKLPTSEELRELVKDKIITQDEAREVLFSSETEEDRDKKSLESEIKFLRELVEKLSKSRTEIVETIRYIESPYKCYPWYSPYTVWCSSSNNITDSVTGSNLSCAGGESNGQTATYHYKTNNFGDIKTF